MSGVNDEELARRFIRGDLLAFEALVHKYKRPLYSFILRSTRDAHVAEDVLQDVFLRVIQGIGSFEQKSKFSTWLYSIARNLLIDTSRKMRFRRHASLDARRADDGQSLGDKVPAAVQTDRAAVDRELRTRIEAAVDALPPDQREVFLLRETQGLGFKEIAHVVGAPENTVKSRMRYALERLQAALEDFGDYAAEVVRAE